MYLLGELIGVEYLYSQTGKVLHYITEETEEASAGPLSDLDHCQEDDEGFVDDGDDQTVAPAETVMAAQPEVDSSNVSGEERYNLNIINSLSLYIFKYLCCSTGTVDSDVPGSADLNVSTSSNSSCDSEVIH